MLKALMKKLGNMQLQERDGCFKKFNGKARNQKQKIGFHKECLQ